MCGFGVQELKHQKDVVKKVHTKGCIHKLQQYFEKNLFTVGIVALCVAVTQLGGKKRHFFYSFNINCVNYDGKNHHSFVTKGCRNVSDHG